MGEGQSRGGYSRRAVITASGAVVVLSMLDLFRDAPAAFAATPTLPAYSGTSRDASIALSDWLASAGPTPKLVGDYFLDSELVVPDSVRELEFAGVKLKIRGDHVGVARRGTVDYREDLPASVPVGVRTFKVRDASAYRVGEYIMVSASPASPGPPENYGWLRRVTVVSSTKVTVDKALPRPLELIPRVSSIGLSPSLRLWGQGEIFAVDPMVSTGALVYFFAVDNPQLSGIDIHHNGGTGVLVAHSLGGRIDTTIHDLLDDGVRFGYGVTAQGCTRGLVVAGTISRVRHAVTTNAASWIRDVGSAGEPEECWFEPVAVDCTDKSLDSHRVGWGNTYVPHVTGGLGGVQIRADNTLVLGGSIVGSRGPGISVRSEVLVAPTISGVAISYLEPSGIAIKGSAPFHASNVTVRDCFGEGGVNFELSSNSTVVGGSISAGANIGVRFRGSNNRVTGIQLGGSVTTPYIQDSGATGNVFESAPPTGIEPLPAPTATTRPSVTGSAKVGQIVTASAGVWDRAGLEFTFTWIRGDTVIAEATERSYRDYQITAADLGYRLKVLVRARRSGYTTGEAVSYSTVLVKEGPAPVVTTAPLIKGTPAVGQKLTATQGTWSPNAKVFTFQWAINGQAVSGATNSTFTLPASSRNQLVSVTVTAKRDGYIPGVFTTPGLRVN